ncbi:MAG: hypothetical protein DMF00_06190 [Verrucomicrobia bacterium]|nr:MAG: hypothetical protein DMF00_06190 [Verrucomicrobiota bacterium]
MKRKDFLTITSGTMLALAMKPRLSSASSGSEAASWHKARKFVDLPFGRVAYVEKGEGPAALFVHGWSLNGYQWRGALDQLHTQRRCIAPDMMSMGWTETPDAQEISPATQAAMLGQLLDKLRIDTVDLVGNDSGGLTAQLFLAKYPTRVHSLLLMMSSSSHRRMTRRAHAPHKAWALSTPVPNVSPTRQSRSIFVPLQIRSSSGRNSINSPSPWPPIPWSRSATT